jgi:hypothetical protein
MLTPCDRPAVIHATQSVVAGYRGMKFIRGLSGASISGHRILGAVSYEAPRSRRFWERWRRSGLNRHRNQTGRAAGPHG